MSHSNYGGEDKNSRPKEHINYGEKNQNMQGDTEEKSMDSKEQPEKTEPTKTSSYNISPTGGNPLVSDDLRQRVIEVLQQDAAIEDSDIRINIKKNNCVELGGSVPDQKMIDRAVKLIREMGVSNIDNDLIVREMH